MLDSLICLQEAQLKVCVDANLGGHIIEFSLAGHNALATEGPEVGSTFWPSPQHAWGWPPPKALDKGLYDVVERKKHIELRSAVCERTGLQLKKTFILDAEGLQVDYTMINPGDEPLSFAPWEITRVYGGVTFYQSDEPPLALSTGTAVAKDGYIWHDYHPEMQEQNEKVYGNGSSGWLANAFSGLLLIKEFDPLDVSEVAPGEAEIEIYSHGDPQNAYIEIEQQGAYQRIPPHGQVQWRVRWHLYSLPKDLDVVVGNEKLPELVRALLGSPKK